MKRIKLSALAAINLALLFSLQWTPVTLIGTGLSTDILFSALVIPQIIAAIFSSNILQVLIPILVEEKNSIYNGIFGSLAIIICVGFALLYIFLALITPYITSTLYPNYDSSTQLTISSLIKISLIGSFFTTMVATYSAAYYTENRAFQIELFGVISGMLALIMMLQALSTKENLENIIWSINLRWIICFIILFSLSKSKKVNIAYKTALRKVISRLKNLIFGGAIYKTDVVVDRYFSAQTMPGDLTILHIVQQIFAAISALLNKVILTPSSPQLAQLKSDQLIQNFDQLFIKIIKKVLFLNCFCFFFLALAWIINSQLPDIKIANTLISNWLFVATLTSGVILGGTLGGVFTVRYYSIGNTITPTKVGLFNFLTGSLLKIFAFYLYGFSGLLIAISLYYLVPISIYFYLYKKENSNNQ